MELRPGLKQLLSPFSEREFLSLHWPEHSLVVHDRLERLSALSELFQLKSPEDVLSVCSGTSITAMMPDRRDESNSVQVTPDVALKLYQSGMNLSVGSAERFFPRLEAWIENLKLDLGLPKTTWGRCIVYLSPPNAGAPPHFDPNSNFSLQLKGHKTWTIAPNESVSFPTERFVLELDQPSSTLRAQAHADFPRTLPDSKQRIELSPGSLLFVPRGYWHETTSEEHTISLNFVFSQQTWAVIAAHALVKRLHRREAWRKTPNVRIDGPASLEAQRKEARELLLDLQHEIAEMQAAELLRAPSSHVRSYRAAEAVRLRRDADQLMLDIAGRGRMPIDSPAEFLPVFDFVFERAHWFRVEDVLLAVPGVSETDVVLLIRRLSEEKLLDCRDD